MSWGCPYCGDTTTNCIHAMASAVKDRGLAGFVVASDQQADLRAAMDALGHSITMFDDALSSLGFDAPEPVERLLERSNRLGTYTIPGIQIELGFSTDSGTLRLRRMDLALDCLPETATVVRLPDIVAIYSANAADDLMRWIEALHEAANELESGSEQLAIARMGTSCPVCSAPYIEHSVDGDLDGACCGHLLFEWIDESEADDFAEEDVPDAIDELRAASRKLRGLEDLTARQVALVQGFVQSVDERWSDMLRRSVVDGESTVDEVVRAIIDSTPGCSYDHRSPGDDHPGGGIVVCIAWAAQPDTAWRTIEPALNSAARDYKALVHQLES